MIKRGCPGTDVLLAPLLERGSVVRDGPGGRGRRAGLSLSDAGRQAFHRARGPVEAFNGPAAVGLTPPQAAMLSEILDHIRTTFTDQPDRRTASDASTSSHP